VYTRSVEMFDDLLRLRQAKCKEDAKMAIVHVIQESVRGYRSVAFDEHAIKRMMERGVSEDDVLDVLRNPTHTRTCQQIRRAFTLGGRPEPAHGLM
jgi:Domain of unknown function (DUF4258)